MSSKKLSVYNIEDKLSASVDGFERVTDFTKIPWPEWNDADLNAVSWDENKHLSIDTKTGSITGNLFEDPDSSDLPASINGEVRSWKRPHEVFSGAKLTVYNQTNSNFELWIPSILARFEFYRYFGEVLPILQFCALKYGFPVEAETPTFVANTQGEPWRPWHHVYAYCKAGKGQAHKPLYSPYGKYIVRLFYMGCWRQFVVDDRIPCDMDEECMLPCTRVNGELWPILITKALFKIISLTPTMNFFLNDFSLITALTGWVKIKIRTINKTEEEVWRRLCVLLPSYQSPKEAPSTKPNTPVKEKPSSRKEFTKEVEKKSGPLNADLFCFLWAVLEQFSEDQSIDNTSTIAVTMVRECPLKRAVKREKTRLWKRLRWMYWALEKGIWMDERCLPPYRRINFITLKKDTCSSLEPDPKQETTMFEAVSNENLPSSERASTKTSKDTQFEEWGDFYKFYNYVRQICICFKPSFFRTFFRITSLAIETPEVKKPTEGSKGNKTAAKTSTAPPTNVFTYVPIPKKFGNEPAYLFCESPSEIFICVSLCVCPEQVKRYAGYLESGQPEFLKVGHACLIIETFDWKDLKQGEIIGFIKTVGTSSACFSFKPGRHILKIWVFSSYPYIARVYSNVEIGVYEGPKIRYLMEHEAERILIYINEVSNAFLALTQKFGKPDLSLALRQFYATIIPKTFLLSDHATLVDLFVEAFLNSIVTSLKSLIPNMEELRILIAALRSLFINLNIKCVSPGNVHGSIYDGSKKTSTRRSNVTRERSLSEILGYPWTLEEISKIIKIQTFFRGYRVRLLLKNQEPSRKEFKTYTERLKKICDTVFVPTKREVEVGKIIRNVVIANPELLKAFKFHEDFSQAIHVEEFNGKIANAEYLSWVPIARFIVACHCKEPVPCAFYFSSNLEEYIIQAINNDTNEELFRLSNSVSPHYYYNNAKGYTIFAFGWNKANVKTITWQIEMVRMKHFQVIHLCNTLLNTPCHPYSIPNLEVLELKNYYVPNHKSRICRFLIKVYRPSLLTLRLSTSYSQVCFRLSVTLHKKFVPVVSESEEVSDKIVVKTASLNGAVLLPSVFLDFVEPNSWYGESVEEGEPTIYVLEAVIIDNSWPLTRQEWGVVEPLRVNGESWRESAFKNQKKERSDSRKKLSKSSRRSLSDSKIESPFWLLQVLQDSSDGHDFNEGFTIEEDKSNIESIRAMKVSWEEKDPGRKKRGRELRMKFLNSIIPEEQKTMSEQSNGDIKTLEEDRVSSSKKSIISIINNFSYLTENTSPRRLSRSPRILPKMPTKELLKKYSKTSKQKVISDVEHLMSGFGCEIEDREDFFINHKLIKLLPGKVDEDRKKFLNISCYYRDVMEKFFVEERFLSALLMEEAYEARQKAIERFFR